MRIKDQERFDTKYVIKNGHWMWKGSVNNHGLPAFHLEGQQRTARYVSSIMAGTAKRFDTWSTKSTCGVSLCVNPEHIKIIGCARRGNFTKPEVKAIRLLYNEGHTLERLAAYFNCAVTTIHGIKSYETYCNIS